MSFWPRIGVRVHPERFTVNGVNSGQNPSNTPSPLMGEGQGEGENTVLPLTIILSHKGRGDRIREGLDSRLRGNDVNKRIKK
jgi:hypothetical protein